MTFKKHSVHAYISTKNFKEMFSLEFPSKDSKDDVQKGHIRNELNILWDDKHFKLYFLFLMRLFIKVVLANHYVSKDKFFSESCSLTLTVLLSVTVNLHLWE